MQLRRATTVGAFLLTLTFLTILTEAHNITRLIAKHPEFLTFNHYLTLTHLVADINDRTTITVCSIDNSTMSTLSLSTAEKAVDEVGVDQRFERLDWSNRMLEQRLRTLKIGTCRGGGVGDGWIEEAMKRVDEEGHVKWEVSNSVVLGFEMGMKIVKGMIFGERI